MAAGDAERKGITVRRAVSTGLAGAAVVAVLAFAASSSQADVVPEHAINVCQSASFYLNFDHSTNAPAQYLYTLPYGQKVGHTPGKQPDYYGWDSTFDFQTQQWGYMEDACIGGYGSW